MPRIEKKRDLVRSPLLTIQFLLFFFMSYFYNPTFFVYYYNHILSPFFIKFLTILVLSLWVVFMLRMVYDHITTHTPKGEI